MAACKHVKSQLEDFRILHGLSLILKSANKEQLDIFNARTTFGANHIEISVHIVCVVEGECIFAVIDWEDFGMDLTTGSSKTENSLVCAEEGGVFGGFAPLGCFEEDPYGGI